LIRKAVFLAFTLCAWNCGTVESLETRNPLGLVDEFGDLEEHPLRVGDETTTANSAVRRNAGRFAQLFLSLSDRDFCKQNWKQFQGFSRAQKSDNCQKHLVEEGRILRLDVGETIRVIAIAPPKDKQYVSTYFKGEVISGPNTGETGWLSHLSLNHN
jgi:hypothetical protein